MTGARIFGSWLSGLAVTLLCAGAAPAATQATETNAATGAAVDPQPFSGTFAVVWHGMNAGTMTLLFVSEGDGKYRYESRANARGMFRAFFSEEITQISSFELHDDILRPLRYRADDGSSDTERDISLDFDWNTGRVTGTAENKRVDLELPPGAQDVMSMQLAVTRDLLRGAMPPTYTIVDKDAIKEYRYIKESDARIKTALGELDTVVYRAERGVNARRATRTWYAPSLGYTPVRAERLKDGKREWMMEVRTLTR